jgi:hypothetical protein
MGRLSRASLLHSAMQADERLGKKLNQRLLDRCRSKSRNSRAAALPSVSSCKVLSASNTACSAETRAVAAAAMFSPCP